MVVAVAPQGRFAVSVAVAIVVVSAVSFVVRRLEIDSVFFGASIVATTAAVVFGILRNRPARAAAWWFIAAAITMYFASYASMKAYPAGGIGSIAAADVFRIVGYIVMAVGLTWWISDRRTRSDMTPLIDGVLISLGVLFVTWVVFLSPILALDDIPGATMSAGLYPAFDAGIFTLTAYLVIGSRGANTSVRWLTVGFAAFFVGDMAYAVSLGERAQPPTWVYQVAFGVGLVSFAAAALDRSMTGVAELPLLTPPRSPRRGVVLLVLLALCALIPLVVTARNGGDLVFRTVMLTLIVMVTFLRGERALRRAQASEDRARHDAEHDSLTGLPNRAALAQRIGERDVTILFVDLDNFKIVNDSYGHRVGDELIAAAASRIRTTVQPSDSVVRYSGDEFVVSTDLDRLEAESLARRIVDSVGRPYVLGTITVYVTATVGIARGRGTDARGGLDDVIRDADTAMYRAKSQGAGSVSFFDESLRLSATRELELATAMRGAVDRGEFEVYYQPIVATGSRNTVVFEALLRWHHGGELVGPLEFVPIAESTNLIGEIGEWVLDTAIAAVARMRANGRPDVTVSVNVSALQLRDDCLPDTVRDILSAHGVDGSVLSLEVTESMLVDDADKADSLLARLAAQGILVVLDDFGMGYSSLSRLRHMPIAVLKIDKSFVAEIGDDSTALSLLSAITSMADALSIITVAEGVETELQMTTVTEMGCRFAQGFLFGKPAPLAHWLPDADVTALETPSIVAER
ncbi:putative bifunctional diguanylate cyclase/phosphodiesterase [Actinomycetes bacterium M1A6_2h]